MPALIRPPAAFAEVGQSRSAFYADIKRGLMVRPIKIGTYAAAFPSAEIDAIVKARIAGKGESEIRDLVARLEAERKTLA